MSIPIAFCERGAMEGRPSVPVSGNAHRVKRRATPIWRQRRFGPWRADVAATSAPEGDRTADAADDEDRPPNEAVFRKASLVLPGLLRPHRYINRSQCEAGDRTTGDIIEDAAELTPCGNRVGESNGGQRHEERDNPEKSSHDEHWDCEAPDVGGERDVARCTLGKRLEGKKKGERERGGIDRVNIIDKKSRFGFQWTPQRRMSHLRAEIRFRHGERSCPLRSRHGPS